MNSEEIKIKIEQGIPIPAKRTFVNRYPWNEMQIGDSFETPAKGIRSTSCIAGKRMGRKFTTREMPNGKYRVWRVA